VAHPGDNTIFVHTWHRFPDVGDEAALTTTWAEIRAYRSEVLKKLEDARGAGVIGSSLQAEVEIRANGRKHGVMTALGDDLRFVLITSSARVAEVPGSDDESIVVTSSTHRKCERCWHYRQDVGVDPAHPQICARCFSNLFGAGEPRTFA
jgi:isoleucyl-tRNA synthetase